MTKLSSVEALANLNDEDLAYALKAVNDRRAQGDKVHVPGAQVGTITSKTGSMGGAPLVGGQALHPDVNKSGNMAYFQGYNDPSESMHVAKRDAMLRKSLFDLGYTGKKNFKSFGDFLKCGWTGHRDSDFRKRHAAEFDGIPADFFRARGMSTISGEDGGFLVAPEYASTIESLFFPNDLPEMIDTMPISGTNFRWPRARDTNRADGSRHGGAIGYWVDEGNPITESKLKIGFADLRMKKLCVLVFMTPELMNDTDFAVETWVRNAVRAEANFQIAYGIALGGGGVEPYGFLRSQACVTVPKRSGQAADTIVTGNLLDMESRLFTQANSNPVWMSHKSTIPETGALQVGNMPVNINIMNGGISLPPQKQLRGLPNLDFEFASTLGDLGDIMLVDTKQIKAIRRSLVREDVSMHVEFLTDQNCLRFIFGFDSRTLYDEPITPFQASATAPPTQASFLQLGARD